MFNIGFGEMVLLAAIALVFIGPKQLPEMARVVGRMLNEFKRATEDLTGSFIKSRDSADRYLKKTELEIQNSIQQQKKEVKSPTEVQTEGQSKVASTVTTTAGSEVKSLKSEDES